MSIQVTIESRTNATGHPSTVVWLAGVLDSSAASSAQQAMAPMLASTPRRVVFDLGDLQFVDSTGIGVLLETRLAIKEHGGDVAMTNVRKPVRRVLDVVKALPGVPIFRDMAEFDAYLAQVQRDARAEGDNRGGAGGKGP